MSKRAVIVAVFSISLVMIIKTCGAKVALLVLIIALLAGAAAIAPFWILAFVLGCILESPRKAWEELNPVAVFKGTILDNTVKEYKASDK